MGGIEFVKREPRLGAGKEENEVLLNGVIKKRKCPECGGEMHPRLINMQYKRNHTHMAVEVIGIPANICANCFYRIIPGKVARYIDSLVDPIFESQSRQEEAILPAPHIDIQFPAMDYRAS